MDGRRGGPLLKRIVDLKGVGDDETLLGDREGSGCFFVAGRDSPSPNAME